MHGTVSRRLAVGGPVSSLPKKPDNSISFIRVLLAREFELIPS